MGVCASSSASPSAVPAAQPAPHKRMPSSGGGGEPDPEEEEEEEEEAVDVRPAASSPAPAQHGRLRLEDIGPDAEAADARAFAQLVRDTQRSLETGGLSASGSGTVFSNISDDDYFDAVERQSLVQPRPVAPPAASSFKWGKGEMLGTGAFGQVFLGLNMLNGKLMAVKCIPVGDTDDQRVQAVKREIALLSSLHHGNIVKYLGTEDVVDAEGDRTLNIFLEFVPGGSIASLIKKFGKFSEQLCKVYTLQILRGLAYLHSRGVVHRDIKGGNILVALDGRCKLADFGASATLADLAEERPALTGTPYWMAPEVIRQEKHGRQVDIWSVGCTIIEMATGRPPWSKQFKSQVATLYHIAQATDPPALPEHFSPEGRDFICQCLRRDPRQRPNFARLLQHPWLAQSRKEAAAAVRPSPPRTYRHMDELGAPGEVRGAADAQQDALVDVVTREQSASADADADVDAERDPPLPNRPLTPLKTPTHDKKGQSAGNPYVFAGDAKRDADGEEDEEEEEEHGFGHEEVYGLAGVGATAAMVRDFLAVQHRVLLGGMSPELRRACAGGDERLDAAAADDDDGEGESGGATEGVQRTVTL